MYIPKVSGAAIPGTYVYSRVHRYYYTEAQDNIGIYRYTRVCIVASREMTDFLFWGELI